MDSNASGDFATHASANSRLSTTVGAIPSTTYGGSDLEPHGVQARSAAPVQAMSGLVSLKATVPDGGSAIFTSTLVSANGELIKQFVASQFYLTRVSNLTKLPESSSNATYMTQEWSGLYDASGVSVLDNPGTDIFCRQIRNSSGAAQTIWVEAAIRYMVNRTDNATLSNSFVVAT